MNCEICGKETKNTYLVLIAGSKVNVCENCKIFGQIISKVKKQEKKVQLYKKPISKVSVKKIAEYVVREDYSKVIKKARENKGLSQEILASIVGEKVSVIKNIEKGKIKPTIEIAKKIEKVLKINLLELESEKMEEKMEEKRTTELTVGDIIEIKENKKKVN